MDIQIGKTKDTVNINKDGSFWATIEAGDRKIFYVSPYAPEEGGGMFAIPGPMTDIMVVKPTGRDEWFYMGSVVDLPQIGQVASLDQLVTNPDALGAGEVSTGDTEIVTDRKKGATLSRIYGFRERPMQSVWGSPKGHKVVLSDQYEKDKDDNSYIGLRSSLGKKLVLDDSKGHIKLANEHGDFMRLSTTARPPAQQSNSFTVNTRGNHLYQSRAGNLKLAVAGSGGNINIVNNATGDIGGLVKGMVGLDNSTWGKINLLANRNDITLTCGPSLLTSMMGNPSIYLTTQGINSAIDLFSVGTVNITSVQGISLNSLGPIDINSLSTITMNAPLIDLNPII